MTLLSAIGLWAAMPDTFLDRARHTQENRRMGFEEAFEGWVANKARDLVVMLDDTAGERSSCSSAPRRASRATHPRPPPGLAAT